MKLESRCKVCRTIREEYLKDSRSKLENRLYNCAKFVQGGEPQTAIMKDYGFTAVSIGNHLKYHQNPNENTLIEKRFERNAENKAKSAVEIQDAMVEEGLKQLEEGNLKMSAATLAKIAKDKQDVEEKNKDRSLKVMEMVFTYAAREQLPPDITPLQLTEDNLSR